jgi:hypothetical protein
MNSDPLKSRIRIESILVQVNASKREDLRSASLTEAEGLETD